MDLLKEDFECSQIHSNRRGLEHMRLVAQKILAVLMSFTLTYLEPFKSDVYLNGPGQD